MFDAMKFTGDHIDDADITSVEVGELLGVYPVVYDSDNHRYEISDNPDGKLMVFKTVTGADLALYFKNNIETSQLVDLL